MKAGMWRAWCRTNS